VTDERINVLEKQRYTFTNKSGVNKFVPVVSTVQTRPSIIAYSSSSKNQNSTTTNIGLPTIQNNHDDATNIVTEVETSPIKTNTFLGHPEPLLDLQQPASPSSQFQRLLDCDLNNIHQMTGDEFVTVDIDNVDIDNLFPRIDNEYAISGSSSPTNSMEDDVMTIHSMDMDDVTNIDLNDIQFDLLDATVLGPDPDYVPPTATIVKTFKDLPELVKAMGREHKAKTRTKKRHTKGPVQLPLEQIPEENRNNVIRCREYRKNKTVKLEAGMEELERLEARNLELRRKEERMKEKLDRAQTAYLKLISEGRIKFC